MTETLRGRYSDSEADVAGERIQVLHVDDDPNFVAVAADSLEAADNRVSVETTTSARDGLDRLAESEFDAVIADYDMPEMNGLDLLDRIRETNPDLPFILFTGKGSEEVASEAVSMGVTDYLQKSFGAEVYELLANRIKNAVSEYRARRRAAKSERRVRELTEATNDVLWEFTADLSEVLVINSAYEDIWGRSVADLREDPDDFLRGIHPEDHELIEDAIRSLMDGESADIECRVNAGEGYQRWAWIQGEPITNDAGEIVRVAGFARDVTERRNRERELREVHERMEIALETTDTVVWDREFESGDLSYYPESETLYGTDVEALDEFLSLVHPEDRSEAAARIESATDTGTYGVEFRIRRDGEVRWIEAKGRVESDGDGTPVRAIGTDREITERKRREQELKDMNKRLEEFTGVVSHDLRNPLSVAEGRIELAQQEHDSEHLDSAGDALARMRTIIDDLLTAAQNGRSDVDADAVALADTAEQFWQNVETDDAELTVETDAVVRADRSRLGRLLENLFSNSVEHGGDDVTVTVGDLDAGFYVEDDGDGIDAEDRSCVFETGYSTSDAGTGFGLWIVAEIADAHDWTVTVDEGSNGGARFEITGVDTAE